MAEKRRLGILTGGGDCPGLNAAIRATAKTIFKMGYEVIGIRNGWKGFVDNKTIAYNRPATGFVPLRVQISSNSWIILFLNSCNVFSGEFSWLVVTGIM